MDIKSLRTNKTYYKVASDIAALLLEEFPEHFERVVPPPPPPPAPPAWGIGTDKGGYVYIFYKFGGEVRQYIGPPSKAADGFKIRRWSGEKQAYVFEGPEPPAHLVEQYQQQWAPRNPGESY